MYSYNILRERDIANCDNFDTKLTMCSQRWPNHGALSLALNSLITTHSRIPCSLLSPLPLSLSPTRYSRGLSRVCSPCPLSIPHHHSHREFYIPWVSCWLPSRVGLRFRSSCFSLRAVPLPSLSLSLRIPFNSPFSPRPHPSAAPPSIYREEVSHTTDSRQFSHLESQNFSLRYPPFSLFLPSSVVPLCLLPLSFFLSFFL